MSQTRKNPLLDIQLEQVDREELINTPFTKGDVKSKVSSWEDTKFEGDTLDLEYVLSPNRLKLDKLSPVGHMSLSNLNTLLQGLVFPMRVTKESLASIGYNEEVFLETLLRLQQNCDVHNRLNVTQNPIESLNSPFITDFRYFNQLIFNRCLIQDNNHIQQGFNRSSYWQHTLCPKATPCFNNTINISDNNLCKQFYNSKADEIDIAVTEDYGFLHFFRNRIKNCRDDESSISCGLTLSPIITGDNEMLFVPDFSFIASLFDETPKGLCDSEVVINRRSNSQTRLDYIKQQSEDKSQSVIYSLSDDETTPAFVMPPGLFLSEIQKIWDEIVLTSWFKTKDVLDTMDRKLTDTDVSYETLVDNSETLIKSIESVMDSEGFYYETFRDRLLQHYDPIELIDIGNESKIPINNSTSLEGISPNYFTSNRISINKQYTGDNLIISFLEDYSYDKTILADKLNHWRRLIRPFISNLLETSTSINSFLVALLNNEYYNNLLVKESFGIEDIVKNIQQPHKLFQQTVINSQLKIVENASKSGVGIGDFMRQLM